MFSVKRDYNLINSFHCKRFRLPILSLIMVTFFIGILSVPASLRAQTTLSFETGTASIGSSWTVINLTNTYVSPVVVCVPNYDNNTIPIVVRVRNAGSTSFEAKLQNPSDSAVVSETIHYIVMEEGAWQLPDDRYVEAALVVSDNTSRKYYWDYYYMEEYTYQNTYDDPVVFGQVMTANDDDWSTFWSSDGGRYSAADEWDCYVGKHVGEDTDTTRATETLGVIVIEQGSGTILNTVYEAFVGPDTIEGVVEYPPYTYVLQGFSSAPEIGIVTKAAMDGSNGDWAYLYGSSPLSVNSIDLAIDEDQINDSERSCSSEQLSCWVFGSAVVYTEEPVNNSPVANIDNYRVTPDTQFNESAPGVLANDTDPDSDPLTATLVSDVSHGTLTLDANGSFSYTPASGYTGEDSFTYQANDGTYDSNIVTVTLAVTHNIAQYKSVTCSSEDPERPSSRAVDGDALSYWYASGYPEWVEVDLGTAYDIYKTEVICTSDRDHRYIVEVATTQGGPYTQVADRIQNTLGGTEADPLTDTFHPVSARYVRLTVTGASHYTGTSVKISEFRIFNGGSASAPVAHVDRYSVIPDTAYFATASLGVLYNDTDAASDPLTATLVSDVSHGTLTLNSDGSFTYTPDTGHTGEDRFWYKANDGTEDSNDTVVTLTVKNNILLYKPVTFSGENSDYPAVNAVDESVESTWSAQSFPQWIEIDLEDIYNIYQTELVCYDDRAYRYIVETAITQGGPYTQIVDRTDNTTEGTIASPITDTFDTVAARYVRLTVSSCYNSSTTSVSIQEFRALSTGLSNLPLAAIDDSYSTTLDTALNESAPGVLGNDTAPGGNPLTAILVTDVTHGSLTLNSDGSFNYTPTTGYSGPDSFTYKANDGTEDSNTALVSLIVTNNIALDKPITCSEYSQGAEPSRAVDGDVATNWSAWYAPPGYLGWIEVDLQGVYSIDQTELVCYQDRAYQYIIEVATTQGGPYTQIINRSDNTTGGSVETPITDTFDPVYARYVRLTVLDCYDYTGDWVTIMEFRVSANSSAYSLLAIDDSYEIVYNTTLNESTPGVLTNDFDADSDPLTAILLTNVSHGSLTLNSNGSFSYTPNTGYTGQDSFTYKANDGTEDSNTAVVTLNVTNNIALDKPVDCSEYYTGAEPYRAVDGNVTTYWDAWYAPTYPGWIEVDLQNVYSIDKTELVCYMDRAYQYIIEIATTQGGPYTQIVDRTSNTTGGSIESPIVDTFSAVDARYVRLTISDCYDYTGDWTTILEFRVMAASSGNNAPVANNDNYIMANDTILNVTAPGVLADDVDADSDPLTAILVSGPTHESLFTLNTDGSFSYTPTTSYTGPDSFTYKANDGTDDSNIATVYITVKPNLSIIVSPGTWDAGSTNISSVITMQESDKITVLNNGFSNASYSLKVANPNWQASQTSPGFNTYVLNAGFSADIANISWNESDHALSASAVLCAAAKFAGDQTGVNVTPDAARTLWLQFKAPAATNVTAQQDIEVIISAEIP